MTQKTLLVVEDDPGLQKQLRWCFEDCEVLIAGNRENAIAALRRQRPAVVVLDLGLPPDPANVGEGFATLEEILRLIPETKVVVVTGNEDRENGLRAIRMGAFDFYHKPVDGEILKIIVDRAWRMFGLERENALLAAGRAGSPLEGVIAASPEMLKVCRTIEKIAPSDMTVMLLGESGTGKEILARALHALSARREKPFIAINCASIPENLLESELFGYEKGAFTGAVKQTPGKIEGADGGTLFLDEIGDLPIPLQPKLLRFLQERVIERVGGRAEIPVDVRVICATHQNIAEMIQQGGFREDLYYRLGEISIRIPALRERNGDAVMLARALLRNYTTQYKSKARGFSQDALHAIEHHAWPGNVRELMNRIKRAAIMAEGSLITPEDLEIAAEGVESTPVNLREVREHAERLAITRALHHTDGNVSQAAILLGVSRPTLYDLMIRYGLKQSS